MSEFQPPDPEENPGGKTFADRALWNAYSEGRADEREQCAPMLVALKKVRRGDLHQRVRPLYDEIQAAIAKAEGEA